MRIATFNVNNVVKRLGNLLAWLEATSPDVACLQELKTAEPDFPAAALPAPDRAIARRGQRRRRKIRLRRLQLLQADRVGCRRLEPGEQVVEPPGDVVDVEGRDPQPGSLPAQAATRAATVARWSAAVSPVNALRGRRSWSPSSSHRISIAGDSA